MKIATWNVNSLRVRLPHLLQWLAANQPDIVALQETKVRDEEFPLEACKDMGFPYIVFKGMPSYNGVCFLSKLPIASSFSHSFDGKDDCRHLSVNINGINLHNIYIPAGGYEPDAEFNDKFAHKLRFLKELGEVFASSSELPNPKILLGDFNVAPLETDVWNHKQMLNVVSHTPVETNLLNSFQKAGYFIDAIRHFYPEPEHLYSWWSYRAADWQKSNRGRRLDHIWVSPDLSDCLDYATIFSAARGENRPSDHVPVLLEVKNCF